MRAWLCLAACAALGLVPGHVSADAARPALRVRDLAAVRPTNLRMRPVARAAAAATNAATAPAAGAAPGTPAAQAPDPSGADLAGRPRTQPRDAQPGGRSLAERVVFRFNIGFGLDGGQPSETPRWTGTECGQSSECAALYTKNRIYGFGDAVLGSRGVGSRSLNTYFATQFRFDQDLSGFSAVPSVYDGEDVSDRQVRSGYVEVENLPWSRWLRRFVMRAGRQYRYGPGVVHFDGLSVSYETRRGSLSVFGGNSVSLYKLSDELGVSWTSGIVGVNARLNLVALGRRPIVLTANSLLHDLRVHTDWGVAVRWRRDLDTKMRLRNRDGKPAQADMQVRARLSPVTVATLDLVHSTERDWRYDAFLVAPQSDLTDARRYLNLEPPGPRTYVSLRAGTVLLDNVDLLLRGAGVVEHDDPDDDATAEPDASFASSYIEGGAALELRLQRTLSLGLSMVARGYRTQERPVSEADPLEVEGPQELGNGYGYAHARSFVEAGLVVRYTQGARLFNAEAEAYARAYEREHLYVSSDLPIEDERVGGRMSVESWAGERLRLRVEYDVTAGLPVVPELRGLKSLRVLMEGRF